MARAQRAKEKRYWIGIDIGGTFTDYVVHDALEEKTLVYKSPTPASKRAEAVLAGLRSLLERYGIAGADVAFFGHGTTVATNAILAREAPLCGVLTTRGFGDTLVIRRQTRPDTFDYYADFPPPLVPRDRVLEITERLDASGAVVTPLASGEVVQCLKKLVSQGVESVAICFLHSYANPSHERQAGAIAQEQFPDLLLSLSSDLVPEFREYERLSTTVINTYVRRVVTVYLSQVQEGARELGVTVPLAVMQGNGGLLSLETARRQPVALIRSGPAAGVAGAAFVASWAGERQIITLDIGGTSTDVSVFEGETPPTVRDWDVHTFPVKRTALDIRSIGAGGGSIAWVDSGGFLKVGPQSAGAEPGPACYDRGGQEATVTDAHVTLGRIGPRAVLGDTLQVNSQRTWQVMEELGAKLQRSPQDTAAGIIEIMNAAIAQEVHYICTEKGYPPREYTLVVYGGAGPLHAAEVARELGIKKVLIPHRPGLLCALGVLATVPKTDFNMTHLISLQDGDSIGLQAITGLFQELDRRAEEWLEEQEIPAKAISRSRALDMRYQGQNYELTVETTEDSLDVKRLIERFHQRHEETYGYRSPGTPVQCITARLTVTVNADHPPLRQRKLTVGKLTAVEERQVYMGQEHGFLPTPVYLRDQIPAECAFQGPAIVEQMDATTLVLPSQHARVDSWGNILLEFER